MSIACGGIARSHENGFVFAWSANLGFCLIVLVELWAVYLGLYIGHQIGLKNVILELDFMSVHSLVTQDVQVLHTYSLLIRVVKSLVEEHDWDVEIRHVFREANTCVDKLARYGRSVPIGIVSFDRLPLRLC